MGICVIIIIIRSTCCSGRCGRGNLRVGVCGVGGGGGGRFVDIICTLNMSMNIRCISKCKRDRDRIRRCSRRIVRNRRIDMYYEYNCEPCTFSP